MRFLFIFIFFFSINVFAHHPKHPFPAIEPYPTLEIGITKDANDGYNLQIITDNFIFTPELSNEKNKPNQGHAHVYINDIKIARVYGKWFHLPGRFFNQKENIIKVSLHANEHNIISVEGRNLEIIEKVIED